MALCRHGRVTKRRDKDQVAERRSDRFINDPKLIGTWESVDFVADIADFEPGTRQSRVELYLKKVVTFRNGKTDKPAWTWTKGLILDHVDKINSRYEIKEIGGEPYLFLEWKTVDSVSRHRKPKYYVLKKENS